MKKSSLSFIEQRMKDPRFYQEKLILRTTEAICELMEKQGVNREELARRLGHKKGYITRILDGQISITIRKISDIFWALEHEVHVETGDSLEPT